MSDIMRSFDHDYVNDVIERLGRIEPNAKPAWGTLTPQGMIRHLVEAVRYSMGKGPKIAYTGNWFVRRVIAPLIINGILKIPKNIKAPPFRDPNRPPIPPDDLETFHALLEEYLALIQADELEPEVHPGFGDIGVDGWAKLHVVHFEHHMRQFDV